MKQHKRLLAMVLSLVLLLSMIPFSGSAAAIGDWQFSAFGNSTSAANNPSPTVSQDGSITLEAKNGKFASDNEGLSFYYKTLDVPTDANFEISAKAKIVNFNSNATPNSPTQKSFGLMLRGSVGSSNSSQTSNYVAVGGFGVTATTSIMQAVYKKGVVGTSTTTGTQTKLPFSDLNAPTADEEYVLKIRKTGDAYVVTANGKSEKFKLDSLFGSQIYVGMYAARDAKITFSDFDIKVDPRAPIQLKLDTTLMKTEYLKDTSLDTSGLKVTAVYTDNSEEVLSTNDYVITGFDSSQLRTVPITISFNGAFQTINLTIVPLTATALGIKYFPAKTEYYLGDLFDPEGFVVTAAYNSGVMTDLTSDKYTFSIPVATVTGSTYAFDTPGTKIVTVRSTETPSTITTFNVTVNDAQMTGLEVAQPPQKTLYYLGDSFKPNGMVVYARYSDNSKVRLLSKDYTTALDTTTAGAKPVVISYRGQQANVAVTVKQKELTGIQVTQYPKTTYRVGEDVNTSGLTVSKLYDNKDEEVLAPTDYTIDSSNYTKNIAGVYDIKIIPTDGSIGHIVYKVTVREQMTYTWNPIRFGQSSSASSNTITPKVDGSVQLVALDGGGKVTGDHDGISFYYVELDAVKDNFVLSADIKVNAYAKTPYDGQESFGIMARDAIGTEGDSSVFASNIAAVGGYSGGTTKDNGTQLFVRSGVESSDGKGSKGIQNVMLRNERPSSSNTPYKLTLTKTNSGFTGKINNEQEQKIFVPDIMSVQDSKMYVGFYTARLATIDVSNIELKVTAAETDTPKIEAPNLPVTPDFQFVSLDKTSKMDYSLSVKSNVNGTVTIKQDQHVIATELNVEAGKMITLPTTVTQNTYTNFSAVFLPNDTQLLTSYDKRVANFSVSMRTFVPGGDIYVSPTGTSAGTGTIDSPLDLDTAIAYVSTGQKIILQDGRYVRNAKLDIKKGNDGTPTANKYLEAAPGATPIFDFDKKSEGVVLSGNYWHIKGIDFTRTGPNTKGFTVGGNYNIVEQSRFYANGDTGLQISSTDGSTDKTTWPSYNLILNCESFDNIDPSNNNADGFAAKLTAGPGNVFRGDIAHNNIDDGWDLYTKVGSGAIGAVTIEDSIAYNNGTLTNGRVGEGDKNGFKLGGEGIHVPHIIRNSIAFGNGANGFTSNSNPGVRAENNIGFNNAKGNLSFTTYSGIPTDFTINGFVSYQKTVSVKDSYPAELKADNNYMFDGSKSVNKSGIQLTDANFTSLEPVESYTRNEDGSINLGTFLQLIAPLSAPTNLTASASDAKAILTWRTVTGATYYNVYRGLAENGSFDKIATNVTNATYTNGELTNGLTYYYKVTGVNDLGEGQYSNLASVVPYKSNGNPSGGSAAPTADLTSNEDGVQVVIPPVNQTINGKVVAVVTVDGGTLGKAFDALKSNESKKITIDVKSNEGTAKVQMDAKALSSGLVNAPDTVLSIKSNDVTYDLPAKSLDLANIATALGTDVSHVKINISIEKVTGPTAELINTKAKQAGLTLLSGAVDFTITAEGNEKTVKVDNFGNTYVPRTITLVKTVDSNQLTAVLFNPETGEMSFVPAIVTTVNGKAEVTIKRQGNSIYTVVQASKTFDDVKGHWAKNEIELLASKLVIKGTSDTTFGPNNHITRAEFAALLVRSLGLKEEASTRFKDVPANSWFAGTAGASAKAGLIEGFEDNTFRPNERITREQMAVMITRAMTFAGKSATVDLKQLDKFTDSMGLSSWSKDAVARAVSAGIVNGVTETEFVPAAPATRAESAVMLKRFLQFVQFIN
ncbi:S-layer homology domain-containing protein [Paenibacillus allorhizoplanae]|uniref:S-layer homology domain-containing protein n=1 Tax=Paenibacillus allorhizoplanae TaxID=2905648 RepID=UPI001F2CA7D9|nr:S-layer homology domain-containing protein [Paenibacillus allorhizoplanae]